MGNQFNPNYKSHSQKHKHNSTDNKTNSSQISKHYPKCKNCKQQPIDVKFKNTSIHLCNECYLKRKQQQYENDIQFKGEVQINEITPQLYLGNNESAKNKEMLLQMEITHILVVGFYLHEYYPDTFTYKTIEIEDNDKEQLIPLLIPAFEFIERAEKCLVHCRAGISRSSSIVIAYIMFVGKLSYEEARKYVSSKRSEIEPNENFEAQLKNFEDILVVCDYNVKLMKEFIKNFGKE